MFGSSRFFDADADQHEATTPPRSGPQSGPRSRGDGPPGRLPGGSLLFAYGSNLYPPRLRARVRSARYVEPAALPAHELRFHKRGTDASAKADAHRTGRSRDVVWGVLFTLDPADKSTLDRIEGPGYHEVLVRVETRAGARRSARMYQARPDWRTEGLRPFRWYRDYVLAGAEHHGFPSDYIRTLRAIEATVDPDVERRRAAYRLLATRTDPRPPEPPNRT